MRKTISILLLVGGLLTVAYGLMEKDDKQSTVDLGIAEVKVGEKDSAFSPYFIVGGIAAVAGLVLLVAGRKS